MCGLEADEVAAIPKHEQLPDIVPALGAYLLKQASEAERIRQMMIDYIHKALDESHIRHGAELFMVLGLFLKQHPEARTGLPYVRRSSATAPKGPSDGVSRPHLLPRHRDWRRIAAFDWNAWRAVRVHLVFEVLWPLALVVVAVLPALGAEHRWINPTLASRLIWAEVQNGRSYEYALNDTEPFMNRELDEATNACVQEQPQHLPEVMPFRDCMANHGWWEAFSPQEAADAYQEAWETELERHDRMDDPGVFGNR
jgi:hypothetical protein